MAKRRPTGSRSPSQLIIARIDELDDWRGATLARIRALVKAADPDIVEEWKWDVPVWSHDGLICTGEVYKSVVKMTFAKGAALKDPSGLFNSSLQGNTRRAIDIREGETINEKALKALIRAAVTLNTTGRAGSPMAARKPARRRALGALALIALLSPLTADAAETTCAELAGLSVPVVAIALPSQGARVQSAEVVAGSPEYCKVIGVVAPVDPAAPPIAFQVNLPVVWNGKALRTRATRRRRCRSRRRSH
jgi:hypothetical protein